MQKYLALLVVCAAAVSASEYSETELEDLDPRLFNNLLNTTANLIPISIGAVLTGLGSILVLILLGIGIWLLVTTLLFPKFDSSGYGYDTYGGYGGGYGGGHSGGSSYSGYQARSASPYASVFDKLSVLDWIAMMEEVYRKFDATSVDCQKRLVCELHQNENTWGSTARKMNDAFGYLQYFELLNLPEDLRMMLEEYLEAANKGRTSQNSCEELFPACEFSMKSLISKYNGSNSI